MRQPPSRFRIFARIVTIAGGLTGLVLMERELWIYEAPLWFKLALALQMAALGFVLGIMPGGVLHWIADWRLARRLGARFIDVLGSGS